MTRMRKLDIDSEKSLFASKEELEYLFGKLFQYAQRDPHVAKQICARALILQWQYDNPRHTVTVNAAKDKPAKADTFFDVIWGSEQASHLKPNVILRMSANIAHYYFLDKVNAFRAIASKQIKFSPIGAMKQILELEPSIRPLCKIYPDVLRELGREDLLSVK